MDEQRRMRGHMQEGADGTGPLMPMTEVSARVGGRTTTIEAIRKTVVVGLAPAEAFDLFTSRIASWSCSSRALGVACTR